jgi:hypothetical protein
MSYGPEWEDARQVALQRDFNRCMICGHRATDVHHRQVQGMGGRKYDLTRHNPEKLVSFCREHHNYVHVEEHRPAAEALGYFLRFGEPPERQYVWSPVDCCWYELMTSGVRLAWPNLREPEKEIT